MTNGKNHVGNDSAKKFRHDERERRRLGKVADARWSRSGSATPAVRSLAECAAALGISRQAASHLERNALYKLRVGLIKVVKEINPELAEALGRTT